MQEHRDHLGDLPLFWREADGPSATGKAGTVYLHGMPTSSDDWLPFLTAHGGLAPDLPGFGRSGKPGHFDYSPGGYAAFLDAFLAHADVHGEVDLVMHDWGAVAGLAWAARAPQRVGRLVLLSPPPLLPGAEWGWVRRLLSRPPLGELAIGGVARPMFARGLRTAAGGPVPDAVVDHLWACFDQGTQRAVIRLHRAMNPAAREAFAADLTLIRTPALVASGANDPYSSSAGTQAWGGWLAEASIEVVPDAGHWPWLDEKSVIDRVSRFLTGGMTGPG